MESLRSWRAELVLAAFAAGWAVIFVIPRGAALLLPPLFFLTVLAYQRLPQLAALGIVAAMVVERAAGMPDDNPAGLPALLVVAFGVGRHASRRTSALLLVVWFAVVVAFSDPAFLGANLVFASVIVAGPWLFGYAVRRRSDAATAATAMADRLSALDPSVRAAQVVAEERARLAAEVVRVVRSAVQEIQRHAEDAGPDLDLEQLESVQEEGRRAIAELRRLLGLLRCTDPPPASTVAAPGTRWRSDVALAAGLAVLLLAELRVLVGQFPLPGWPVGLALVAVVALRRAEPMLACLLALLTVALADVLDVAVPYTIVHLVVFALLAWSVAVTGRWRAHVALAALAAVVVIDVYRAVPVNLGINLAAFVLAAAAGHLWVPRDRQQRRAVSEAESLRRVHDAIAARAVQAERLRLARELHDVASHAIGVMVLQAGAAAALRADDPEGAREAVRTVEATAASAVRELDALAGLIEAGAVGPLGLDDAGPEGDLGEGLRSLVERMGAGPLQVSLTIGGRLPDQPEVAATVFRVVQEALTNAARHAPDSAVTVAVRTEREHVEVEVHDDGPGRTPTPGPGAGFGLVGLAERVRGLGGELAAGPRTDGGFSVAARLPVAAVVEARP